MAAICYLPAATLLFEWFQARRGLASGVMYAGTGEHRSYLEICPLFTFSTGIGGTVFPFAMRALLDKFGYKLALIILASRLAVMQKYLIE
jgi:hypothetical protein